jgi:hypothetical protein
MLFTISYGTLQRVMLLLSGYVDWDANSVRCCLNRALSAAQER